MAAWALGIQELLLFKKWNTEMTSEAVPSEGEPTQMGASWRREKKGMGATGAEDAVTVGRGGAEVSFPSQSPRFSKDNESYLL